MGTHPRPARHHPRRTELRKVGSWRLIRARRPRPHPLRGQTLRVCPIRLTAPLRGAPSTGPSAALEVESQNSLRLRRRRTLCHAYCPPPERRFTPFLATLYTEATPCALRLPTLTEWPGRKSRRLRAGQPMVKLEGGDAEFAAPTVRRIHYASLTASVFAWA